MGRFLERVPLSEGRLQGWGSVAKPKFGGDVFPETKLMQALLFDIFERARIYRILSHGAIVIVPF
jgi:hypothetical protein